MFYIFYKGWGLGLGDFPGVVSMVHCLSQATPKEDLESGSDSVHADLEVFSEKGSQGLRVRARAPIKIFLNGRGPTLK